MVDAIQDSEAVILATPYDATGPLLRENAIARKKLSIGGSEPHYRTSEVRSRPRARQLGKLLSSRRTIFRMGPQEP